MKKVIFILCLAATSALIINCSGGFKGAPSSGDDTNTGQSGPPASGPSPTPMVTATPLVVPTPTVTPTPIPPTGGNISCGGLAGRFWSASQICDYARQNNYTGCITLDLQTICFGFGPCVSCLTDGFVPPTPGPGTPPPSTTPTPTPTTPTPTPGNATPTPWPTPGGTPPNAG